MQPIVGGAWGAPSPNIPWDIDCNVGLGRLLHCGASCVGNANIDMTADIYVMLCAYPHAYEQEIEFIKTVRSRGAKVILCISTDYKFLTGHELMNSNGILYTALCKEADIILPGIPSHMKLFGRYQHKVIDMSLFLERINFSLPYEQRDIDILLSGSIDRNELTLSFAIEIMLMLKERYPEKRIVYPTAKKDLLQPLYPEIEFQEVKGIANNQGLVPWLQKSKIYINPDARPGPGRAVIESFYCRTPYICSSMCYASKYYSDFTYDHINFETIVSQYDKLLNSDRNEVIKKSEQLAEEDYFDKAILRLMERLYPNQ
jgi:hypothetical protein